VKAVGKVCLNAEIKSVKMGKVQTYEMRNYLNSKVMSEMQKLKRT